MKPLAPVALGPWGDPHGIPWGSMTNFVIGAAVRVVPSGELSQFAMERSTIFPESV